MAAPFGLDNFASKVELRTHAGLRLRGFLSKSGVENYLNVPYASIPRRFQTARMVPLKEMSGELDATRYGPRCPQGPDELHKIMHHMVERLGGEQRTSEFDCLHVNVYAPPRSTITKPLPCMVYVHGGAFSFGDNTTEFDGNHLVRRSMEIGKPIIVITINYRVAVFGFLAGREMLEEARAEGHTPCLNQGLNDQQIALQWVQEHIRHFGGDETEVTIAGESAGSMAIWFLSRSRTPSLFKRAILMSGPPMGLRTIDQAQASFDELLKVHSIDQAAPYQVKLAALRSLTPEQLVATWDRSIAAPVFDADWLDTSHLAPCSAFSTFADVYNFHGSLPNWLESVIILNARDETSLFGIRKWKDYDVDQAKAVVQAAFPSAALQQTLLLSPLYANAATPFQSLINVSSDAFFIRPSVRMAQLVAQSDHPVYFGMLDTKDAHPLELQGYSWHCLSPSIMFCMPICEQYAEMKVTADDMVDRFTSFLYGNAPWAALQDGQEAYSFDGTSSKMIPFDRESLLRFPTPAQEEEFLRCGPAMIGAALEGQ